MNSEEIIIPLHDGSEELVSIIIVHKDKPSMLNLCLQSIAVTSFNNNYEIIVIDNASGPDSQAFLDEIESEVKLIRNKENIYWGPAATLGAAAASKASKYLIFMHCDVVVLNSGWIDLLATVAEANNSGIVGTELHQMVIFGQQVDYVSEHCMLVTREAWEECGPFPPSLPQIGTAFIFTMKAQQKGLKPKIATNNNICYHYKDFSLDVSDYERLLDSFYSECPKLIQNLQFKSV